MEAGHPIPDERSMVAGKSVLDFTSRIQENDLLICLLSGGGSALVIVPREGLSLTDIQILTKSMLANGAGIDEINVLRCQLDILKGGGLAAATKGKILSLILSDVIGDHLDVIASGMSEMDATISLIRPAFFIGSFFVSSSSSLVLKLMKFRLSWKNMILTEWYRVRN